jgi:hypothetical protein
MVVASLFGLRDAESFDLAGRALLLFACAKRSKQEKAHPGDALSLRESPLRCSRARGNASTRHPVATKRGGHPCPPSPARAALLGASQGNPARQTAQAKPSWFMRSPLPRAGEGGPSGPGEGLLLWLHSKTKAPLSPASQGLSPARGREDNPKQKQSAAKRSEPVAFDVQPLAAPAGVARAVGLAATTAARASSRQGCRVEATPSTSLQPGTRSSAQPSNGRGLGGLLSLLTFFAGAKKVRPDRRGQKLSAPSKTRAEPAP